VLSSPLLPSVLESISKKGHVDIDVLAWHWLLLVGVIAGLLLVDLLLVHRTSRVLNMRDAVIQSSAWIGVGLFFTAFVAWQFGGNGAGEYLGGYLMEMSLSVDNIFVWAMLLAQFHIPRRLQYRVLFWGVLGAFALRSVLIFGGIALTEVSEPAILILGVFLVYTAISLFRSKDNEHEPNPSDGRILRLVHKVIPSAEEIRTQVQNVGDLRTGFLVAPLFAVVVLLELTDVVFAVDSVSAVLTITSEPFLALSSNVFAILGLRALYFLLADVQARFKYLQRGIALILAFVGFKMIVAYFWDWHVSTMWSLSVIVLVLGLSVGASIIENRRPS
jgi:tellurite resistance protein TerC